MSDLCIGLMSGTSLDGVDGVLVEWLPGDCHRFSVLAHCHLGFDAALADELLALNRSGSDELHRAALAGNAVARRYADVVAQLLARSGRAAAEVSAIGAHGQTVRHRPGQFDGTGYTLQLNNPALLAELSGIAVVADLRSRDVAAGGQGAPLVPAFHRAAFGRAGEALAVLNLGGIGNLTLLGADDAVLGFDCGPGNALLDLWVRRHRGQAFDADGRWAASGRVHAALLAALQSDPYFALPPPKSTGRDLFHAEWLDQHLAALPGVASADVQASLAELSAWAAARDLQRHAPQTRELLVCGGGAFNKHLMERLALLLPGVRVCSTAECGLPPDQVEACAFAWLARAFLRREPGNLPSVTGARGLRVLGAFFPA
ncbi:MAG: anhydro-N-acetylmuramic acid kinase [Piscinibacter sp.]